MQPQSQITAAQTVYLLLCMLLRHEVSSAILHRHAEVVCHCRNSICSLGGPIMLLAVAQQEDEVPTVRREAIAALVAVLEDDKRKIEVSLPSVKAHVARRI